MGPLNATTSDATLTTTTASEKPAAKPVKAWKKTLAKIWNVVSKILLGLANALFFLTNPTLYAISFLAGFVFSKEVKLIIDKIIVLWQKHPWPMAIGTGVAGFLSIQITWASASVLFGAHLGATLSQKAQEYLNKNKKKLA